MPEITGFNVPGIDRLGFKKQGEHRESVANQGKAALMGAPFLYIYSLSKALRAFGPESSSRAPIAGKPLLFMRGNYT